MAHNSGRTDEFGLRTLSARGFFLSCAHLVPDVRPRVVRPRAVRPRRRDPPPTVYTVCPGQ